MNPKRQKQWVTLEEWLKEERQKAWKHREERNHEDFENGKKEKPKKKEHKYFERDTENDRMVQELMLVNQLVHL